MKPSQLVRRSSQHIMLYGDAKTGKSTLAAELLLHGYNLTWISLDGGHRDIFSKLPISMEQLDEQLNIIEVKDTKESPIGFGTCRKLISRPLNRVCDTHGQVDCSTCRSKGGTFTEVDTSKFGPRDIMVIDHVSQLAISLLNYIIKDKADDFKPGWDEYRPQGALLEQFFVTVQHLPFNIICISHRLLVEMEDGKKMMVPEIGTRNFSTTSGRYFDHVVMTEMENARHKAGSSTTYKVGVMTGSRSDVAIEKLGSLSLLPFFDGSIKPKEEAGSKAVERVLQAKERVSQPPKVAAPVVSSDPGAGSLVDSLAATNDVTLPPTPEPEPGNTTTAVSNAQSLLARIRAAKSVA